MKVRHSLPLALAGTLAACASKPITVAVTAPPPPVPLPAAGPPNGAAANLVIPVALPDGSYPTPNIGLSDAAAIWHFRVAMNVAALGCRGPEANATVAAYNAMLTGRKVELAGAEKGVAAQYAAAAPAGRDAYDDAMTRLYNFFAQPPAQDGFCAAAAQAMAGEAGVPTGGLAAYARATLPALDRPFTDFYRAYAAWQTQRDAARSIVTVAAVAPVPAVPKATPRPALELDLGDLTPDTPHP